MRRASTALFLLLIAALPLGCNRAIRSGPLVTGYESAECIPVHFGPGITPPTRSWDDSLTTSSGQVVHISGAQMPGGRISVRYGSDVADIVAADAGDYIYPADVRVDQARNRLFVRASGVPAASGGLQVWLFEFDLNHRKEIDRARIDPSVLPHECQIE